jgi:very-short-patch-repair endonuclease
MDRLSFRRDRSKQNQAAGLGWSTLRFTWWDLQDDPYQVGAHIKAMLADRRPV